MAYGMILSNGAYIAFQNTLIGSIRKASMFQQFESACLSSILYHYHLLTT